MAQAGAAAPAMNSQGCARVADAGDKGGLVRLGQAETRVQAKARMRRAEALAAQSCRAQLRQW